ncbi:MAG: HDOD domain-containing protein [Myxococcota bacterium]|nr:HDOD domain-containing protein [Myxococcota bacterium]
MTLGAQQEKLSQTLQQIIINRVKSGNLVLPVQSKLGQELGQLLEDPKTDLPRLTKMIERDPIITAHVIKMTNSALHRRSGKIDSFAQAVEHLGFRNIKNVVMNAISRTIFISHDARINSTVQGMIEHSQAVALLSRNVAGISGQVDAEPAYVAGLLHDIGKLVTAAYLLEFERSLPTREALDWITYDEWMAVIDDSHRAIGVAVIQGWGLPEILVRVLEQKDDYDTDDKMSPLNVVLFSNALTKREGLYEGECDQNDVNSMIMIGKSLLGLTGEVISGLTREINDHIF